tara:strand:- start:530 stop:904 length:375 start_codon:yes stop_codon:yes gene_type:complete
MDKYQEYFNIVIKLSEWDVVDNIIANLRNEKILGDLSFPEIWQGNYTPNVRVPLKHSILELVNLCLTYKAEEMGLDTTKIYMKKGKRYICISDNKFTNSRALKHLNLGVDTDDIELTILPQDRR